MAVSLAYLPAPRGCLSRLADILVIVVAIGMVALFARRLEVDCARAGNVGTCRFTTIGALELRSERTIEGIHSLAHRSGATLHVVTDAKNKDTMAAFGQRQIDLWDDRAADAMQSFVEARTDSVALVHGPAHPAILTFVVMLALLVYAWGTRSLGFLVTIDPEKKLLFVRRRGPLFESRTERYPLASVRSFAVESDRARKRVRLELEGKSLPLTHGFSEGDHHEDFAERARAMLRGS